MSDRIGLLWYDKGFNEDSAIQAYLRRFGELPNAVVCNKEVATKLRVVIVGNMSDNHYLICKGDSNGKNEEG